MPRDGVADSRLKFDTVVGLLDILPRSITSVPLINNASTDDGADYASYFWSTLLNQIDAYS